MRKFAKGLAALAIAVSSVAANAEGYWGGVAGLMNVDVSGVDNPLNIGIRGGYTWPAGWGMEGEFTTSAVKGKARAFEGSRKVDIQTIAGYATYRSPGDIYFKGRAGILNEKVTIGRFRDSDTGISLGFGGGLRFSPNASFELEYTLIESDVDFWSGTLALRF